MKPEAPLTAVYECTLVSYGADAADGLPREKDCPIKLPVWSCNGEPYYGEKVAFNFDRATPEGVTETLTVSCGNTKTVQVKVNPIVEEKLPD